MRRNLRAFDLTEAQRAIRLSLWCQPWHPKKLTFVKEFRSFTDSQKPPVVRTMSKQDRESTDSQRRCEAPEDRGSGSYSAARRRFRYAAEPRPAGAVAEAAHEPRVGGWGHAEFPRPPFRTES